MSSMTSMAASMPVGGSTRLRQRMCRSIAPALLPSIYAAVDELHGDPPKETVAATDSSTLDSNQVAVREFLEVFSTGDVDGILARLHDDATWWVSGRMEGFSGEKSKEEMGKLLAGVTDVYVGGALKLTPTSVGADGDRVFVEADGHAELKNGRVYEPQSAFVFRLDDSGLITSIREYLDTQHAHAIFFS